MSDKRASSSKKHIAYCFSQLVIQQLCHCYGFDIAWHCMALYVIVQMMETITGMTFCLPVSHYLINMSIMFKIYSLHMSQVAHQAKAYPSFWSMKQLGVFLLPPPESIPEPGYPCKTHQPAGQMDNMSAAQDR